MNYKRATFFFISHEKTLNSAEGNKKRCVEIERKISAAGTTSISEFCSG